MKAALFGLVAVLLCSVPGARAAFPFAEATIDDLQARMAAGSLTARELTTAYLARIAAVDRAGPQLNAVIELNPDALKIAERLDAERKAGRVRGALHGIPVLLKDNIATADRMDTTAGSLALVGAKPLPNSFPGVGLAARISFVLAIASFTPVASLSKVPSESMCMKKTLGSSKKKWLCSAVTPMPLAKSTLITGFTSS